MEVNITELVKAKVGDDLVATLDVEVDDVIDLVHDLVNVHKVLYIELVLLNVNRAVEVFANNAIHVFF